MWSRRARLLPILAALVASLATAAPVRATGPGFEPNALDRLTRASRVLSASSIAEAVRLTALAGGIEVDAPPATPAPVPAGVPESLTAPVGLLLAAMGSAEDLASRAVSVSPAGLDALAARGDALVRRSQLEPANVDLIAEGRALEMEMRDAVDHLALDRAAVLVAAAIDDALPPLRAFAATLPAAGDAEGCDVLDLPQVCIGNTGANTYTADVPLQIDLGGNDVYRNSAGGADPVPTLGNGIPVAVTIDVSGNDSYHATFPMASRSRVAQGAGAIGGVGFLVDVNGDDSYLADGPAPKGQGMGYGGVGVLVDTNGTDTYAMRASGPRGSAANGQGTTLLGALGLLLDRGYAGDSYLLESVATPELAENGVVWSGTVNASGQGAGVDAGVAILADDGGTSSIVATGLVEPMDPGLHGLTNNLSTGSSYVQGAGVLGGVGMALTGLGDTTWTNTVEIGHAGAPDLQGSSGIFSQASGNLGAYGALLDLGGDDTYLTSMTSHAVRRLEANPGDLERTVSAYAPDLYNESQGLGYLGGAGVLRDAGGNDTYTALARTHARAEILDHREGPPAPDEVAVSAYAVSLYSRTYAQGVSNMGLGILRDEGGDDRYTANATSLSEAIAVIDDERRTGSGRAEPDRAVTWAQGAAQGGGDGHLVDLSGSDQYRSTNVVDGTVAPSGDVTPAEATSSVQGSSVGETVFVAGTAFFADLGTGTDLFFSLPADPACTGTRGEGQWVDCGPGYAVGINQ